MLARILAKLIQPKINLAVNVALEKEWARRRHDLEVCELFEANSMVGGLHILIPNEICNPIVGYGIRVDFITKACSPITVFQDVVTGEETSLTGKILGYTPQRFEALNSLEPNARIALFYSSDDHITVNKTKTPTSQLIDAATWDHKVKAAVSRYPGINNGECITATS